MNRRPPWFIASLLLPLAAGCGGAAVPEPAAPAPVPTTEIAIAPPPAEAGDKGPQKKTEGAQENPEGAQEGAGEKDRPAAAVQAELEQLDLQMIGAMTNQPSGAGVLTGVLDTAVSAQLSAVGGIGGVQIGSGGGLAGIGSASTGSAPTVKKPVGQVALTLAAEAGGKVANAAAVVAGMKAGFRRCYSRQLGQDPSTPAGSTRLRVAIGPNGEVLSVTPQRVRGLGPEVAACVTARVQSAQFAPPEGGSATLELDAAFDKSVPTP